MKVYSKDDDSDGESDFETDSHKAPNASTDDNDVEIHSPAEISDTESIPEKTGTPLEESTSFEDKSKMDSSSKMDSDDESRNDLSVEEANEAEEDSGPPRPCIVFMDSLNMHSSSQVCKNLQHYLRNEWIAKKSKKRKEVHNDDDDGDDVEAVETGCDEVPKELLELPIIKPKVPKQNNCYDCGVFTLQYSEEVYRRWPQISDADTRNNAIEGFHPKMFSSDGIKVRLMLFLIARAPQIC
jgi:hypothetical protein